MKIVQRIGQWFRKPKVEPERVQDPYYYTKCIIDENVPPIYTMMEYDFNEAMAVWASGYELVFTAQLSLFEGEHNRTYEAALDWYLECMFPEIEEKQENYTSEYQLLLFQEERG